MEQSNTSIPTKELHNRTIGIAHVGSYDCGYDKQRLEVFMKWLERERPEYTKQIRQISHDHIDLNFDRDFLKERSTYDIVILQHVFTPHGHLRDSYIGKHGYFQISPLHSPENWAARLSSTKADFIVMFGSFGEVSSSWVGGIPGYDFVPCEVYDMSVYEKS